MTRQSVNDDRPAGLRAGIRLSEVTVLAGFFVAFFFYTWLRIKPALEYCSPGTVVFLNRLFLDPFLGYPGGLVDYGAALLAQFDRWNWAGAMICTALAALLFLTARRLCLPLASAHHGLASRSVAGGSHAPPVSRFQPSEPTGL